MQVLRNVTEVRAWRRQLDVQHRVGMVPTMGFLHEGHVSLLAEARRRLPATKGAVVLTIFVNPTQFGPNEDLDRYPRDEAGDLAKAEAAGVDMVFCPRSPDELYPTKLTWVDVEKLGDTLCGRARPGHFRGVCTIVTKLWNLIQPDFAVFGEKDYQQLAILRRVHADLFLGGEIVAMPIVREPDGLAMSSRNANLSPRGRSDALAISRFLGQVRRRFSDGERDPAALVHDAAQALAPGRIDYVELVDATTLQALPPGERVRQPVLVAVAAFFDGVRLIDNVVLSP